MNINSKKILIIDDEIEIVEMRGFYFKDKEVFKSLVASIRFFNL